MPVPASVNDPIVGACGMVDAVTAEDEELVEELPFVFLAVTVYV